ncbi:uncharacterized protein LOC115625782 [Scaptodrosophila lebanonensis]|uniref:Uncharacterized protein LOC115625782 n=1 Tax=Drosophila lebanonensis TaxID=7225 RepID=A0A6J2TL99_DROLE|nr:uncharacterized protein LOC115625782 [Scaptodrosophila lebanonensis]
MERNNGRYAYIRRQGNGNGNHQQHSSHNHHHAAGNNVNSSSSSSTAATNTAHNSQYSPTTSHNSNNSLYAAQSQQQSVPLSHPSQHDELIRYIREAWTKVNEQGTPIIYSESDNQLKNFKPFNLEKYWGQRLVENIHVSTQAGGHQ